MLRKRLYVAGRAAYKAQPLLSCLWFFAAYLFGGSMHPIALGLSIAPPIHQFPHAMDPEPSVLGVFFASIFLLILIAAVCLVSFVESMAVFTALIFTLQKRVYGDRTFLEMFDNQPQMPSIFDAKMLEFYDQRATKAILRYKYYLIALTFSLWILFPTGTDVIGMDKDHARACLLDAESWFCSPIIHYITLLMCLAVYFFCVGIVSMIVGILYYAWTIQYIPIYE